MLFRTNLKVDNEVITLDFRDAEERLQQVESQLEEEKKQQQNISTSTAHTSDDLILLDKDAPSNSLSEKEKMFLNAQMYFFL
jgi:hypothetical protein